MRVIFVGAQGSGKDTQARKLAGELRFTFVDAGTLFRSHMASRTPWGREVKAIIDSGRMAPDEITNRMMEERLGQETFQNGVIINGYPRSITQAQALERFAPPTHVVFIRISDEEGIRRIAGRRTCVAEGHVYHLEYYPPRVAGICDVDGSPLRQRDDDQEDAIRTRLHFFHETTEPILEYYRSAGRVPVLEINGEQAISAVREDLHRALKLLV
ncbi:MAG: nucleoside monophosphate kinase [Patescibacteria group bacterium]